MLLLFIAFQVQADPEDCSGPIGWGCQAPEFCLPTMTETGGIGDTVCLSDFAGKVVMINFFGYSCSICQSHRADLEALYQRFIGHPDFQMIGVDNWNGPSLFVWTFYAGCSVAPCEVTFPLLLRGGINGVNDDYCMPVPDDRGYLVVDKEGVVRSYTHLSDLGDAAMEAIADTIRAYLSPESPMQLTILPQESGLTLRWLSGDAPAEAYDVYSSATIDFGEQMFLGRTEETEMLVPLFHERRYFRVHAVGPLE